MAANGPPQLTIDQASDEFNRAKMAYDAAARDAAATPADATAAATAATAAAAARTAAISWTSTASELAKIAKTELDRATSSGYPNEINSSTAANTTALANLADANFAAKELEDSLSANAGGIKICMQVSDDLTKISQIRTDYNLIKFATDLNVNASNATEVLRDAIQKLHYPSETDTFATSMTPPLAPAPALVAQPRSLLGNAYSKVKDVATSVIPGRRAAADAAATVAANAANDAADAAERLRLENTRKGIELRTAAIAKQKEAAPRAQAARETAARVEAARVEAARLARAEAEAARAEAEAAAARVLATQRQAVGEEAAAVAAQRNDTRRLRDAAANIRGGSSKKTRKRRTTKSNRKRARPSRRK